MTFPALVLSAILVIAAAGFASAQECTGTITADDAMKAEAARYVAQTTNDFAAMEKMFGMDLTYNHSSAATDNKGDLYRFHAVGPREVPRDEAEQ